MSAQSDLAAILKGHSAPVAEQKSMGFLEAAREGIQAVAPGLTLSNILNGVGEELKQMAVHGEHELAAALFNGSAFVMYPRAGREEEARPERTEQEIGGREV